MGASNPFSIRNCLGKQPPYHSKLPYYNSLNVETTCLSSFSNLAGKLPWRKANQPQCSTDLMAVVQGEVCSECSGPSGELVPCRCSPFGNEHQTSPTFHRYSTGSDLLLNSAAGCSCTSNQSAPVTANSSIWCTQDASLEELQNTDPLRFSSFNSINDVTLYPQIASNNCVSTSSQGDLGLAYKTNRTKATSLGDPIEGNTNNSDSLSGSFNGSVAVRPKGNYDNGEDVPLPTINSMHRSTGHQNNTVLNSRQQKDPRVNGFIVDNLSSTMPVRLKFSVKIK